MLIVNSCLLGLNLVSDLGIRQKVIQSPRGSAPGFLNTAWTIQIVRGSLLWLLTLSIASPVASYYGQSDLFGLIAIAGSTAMLMGISSTSQYLLDRELVPRRLVVLHVAGQLVSIVTMISWALMSPSVWALLAGSVAGAAFNGIASHWVVPSHQSRLAWNRSVVREIVSFGRWILPATIVYYLLQYGNRLILGSLVTPEILGVFSIAVFVGTLIMEFTREVSARVLLPLYAQFGTREFRYRLRRARIFLLLVALPPACVIVVWGQDVVALLYDDRYADAGWMVQLLAAGSILGIVNASVGSVLLARGDSKRYFFAEASSLLIFTVIAVTGFVGWGWEGVVAAVAAIPVAQYPGMAWALQKHGAWQPGLETAAMLGSALLVLGLFLLKWAWPVY